MLSYRPRFVIRNESSLHARLYTAPDTQRLKAKPRGHPNTDQSLFPSLPWLAQRSLPALPFLFFSSVFSRVSLQRHLLRHYLLMSYYPRFGRECLAKRASKLYFIDGERTDGR